MDDETRQYFRVLAVISSMGFSMVLATFMGFGLGYVLDRFVFGTSPWLTFLFLILGIIAGFRNLYIIAKRVERILSEDPK